MQDIRVNEVPVSATEHQSIHRKYGLKAPDKL